MIAVLERPRIPSSHTPDKPAHFGSAIVVQPSSPAEIATILRDRKRFPSPVRPLGAGSAVTRCVSANGGTVMDLSKMNRVIKLAGDCVSVQPGVSLPALADHLRQAGLELISGFELGEGSVGGAACGAGLGASIANGAGQFAGHVVRLKVIGPDGKRFVVSDNTKSMLGMMRLSYGLLGIVYELTLRVRPITGFSSQTARLGFDEFAGLGARLETAGVGLRLGLLPFRDRIVMEIRRPSQADEAGSSLHWKLRDWSLRSGLPAVGKSLARAMPYGRLRYALMDHISERTQLWVAGRKPAPGSNALEQSVRLRKAGPRRFSHCTWAFPATDVAHVVPAYRDFSQAHYARTGFRCDLPTLAYRLHRDRSAMLSPSFDGPVLTLSPLSTQADGWEDFMFDFAEFAAEHHGIPLFNQTTHATGEQAAKSYGKRLALFAKMRSAIDPGGRLLNQFFATYMAAAGGA